MDRWQQALEEIADYFGAVRQETTTKLDLGDSSVLFITSEHLVDKIVTCIQLRRPVLLVGPRGCGKSYCAEEAIRKAKAQGHIADHVFLQGNREISRDYLSEDQLVPAADESRPAQGSDEAGQRERTTDSPKPSPAGTANEAARPRLTLQRALSLRHFAAGDCISARNPPAGVGNGKLPKLADAMSHWDKKLRETDENGEKREKATRWVCLFMDEINRFSDGFLDSLLSLLEENRIVRSGEDIFVPLTTVLTANPPGYDSTAKPLSPPLQARIAATYRLAHPPISTLVNTLVCRSHRVTSSKPLVGPNAERWRVEVAYMCAAINQLMWGFPKRDGRAWYYLEPLTRNALLRVDGNSGNANHSLRGLLEALNEYIVFGPDGRLVADWLLLSGALSCPDENAACAALRETAVPLLAHRVRDAFAEGARPDLAAEKERVVAAIVDQVLLDPKKGWALVAQLFWPGSDPDKLRHALVELHRKVIDHTVRDRIVYAHAAWLERKAGSALDLPVVGDGSKEENQDRFEKYQLVPAGVP